MTREIHRWQAGRLLQLQWEYRVQEADGAYLLECKLEWQADDHFAPAFGHREAHKIAEELIARDREWLAAEEEAHEEAGLNRNLLKLKARSS